MERTQASAAGTSRIVSSTTAFDGLAADYDESWTESALGRELRTRVWEQLGRCFPAGSRVLDLGCGTGVDACWLAGRGVTVRALDESSAMLEVARRRARSLAESLASFERCDLGQGDELEKILGEQPIDGAYSNFGALNCLPSRRSVARIVAERTPPGAWLVLVLMGPCCPIEIAVHLVRGRFTGALRRLSSGAEVRLQSSSRPLRVWYPTPARLRRELRPWWRLRRIVGLGVTLPPSDVGGRFLEDGTADGSRLFRFLARWDRRLGSFFPGTWCNDHYLAVFERSDPATGRDR